MEKKVLNNLFFIFDCMISRENYGELELGVILSTRLMDKKYFKKFITHFMEVFKNDI